MPEITDEELAAAQRAFALLKQLGSNPDSRPHFERSLKIIDPRIETQEEAAAKIAAPYVAQMEDMKKRLDARDQADAAAAEKRQEDDAMSRLTDGFERLRKEGLTEEGEEKVKRLMVDRNIADPEAAFAYFQRKNPPARAETSAYTPSHWNYETDAMPDTAAWFKNPDKAEDDAIGQVLMEMRQGQDD